MVNGSGNLRLRPGTHGQSGDSAFHRWTCASTIIRLRAGLRDHLLASLRCESQACAKGALEEAAS